MFEREAAPIVAEELEPLAAEEEPAAAVAAEGAPAEETPAPEAETAAEEGEAQARRLLVSSHPPLRRRNGSGSPLVESPEQAGRVLQGSRGMANERDQDEGSGQQPPIGKEKDEQARGAKGQQQFGQQGQQGGGSDMSGGTLGQGQSGGFGNQTSGNPQGGESAFGQPGQSATGQSVGSEPPRSMGHRGTEFGHPPNEREKSSGQQGQSGTGQADLGSQSDTTLAGRSDQQDLGQDQPGSSPTAGLQGTSGAPQGEGFIGSQGSGSDDYLQQQGKEGEQDFAREGQGAPESRSENIETGREEDRDSDIEGGSGNA